MFEPAALIREIGDKKLNNKGKLLFVLLLLLSFFLLSFMLLKPDELFLKFINLIYTDTGLLWLNPVFVKIQEGHPVI